MLRQKRCMITEYARISIDPDRAAEFEAAVAQAAPLFRSSQGCTSMALMRIVEEPGVYMLIVDWERLEDHMTGFRESPAFPQWRALVSPFFASPPVVVHGQSASRYF
jgi:quinol monooxygenase YgiN